MFINLTLENNSVVTLKNCRDYWNAQCVGAYASHDWLADVYNSLLGWLLGDVIKYQTLYVKYEPNNGVKIKKVQFLTYHCNACGFLSANTEQTMSIDYLTYVDASVAPHHLRVTTASNTANAGADVAYTITACGNADCSLPYTTGVSGTLAFSGASPSASNQGFSIPAGPNNATTVTMQYASAGTGTVSVSSHSPAGTNSPNVFCGMGALPTAGGGCGLSVIAPVHHFRVTTPTSSGLTCEPVTYTIQACANDSCSVVMGSGVSGTLNLVGATPVNSAGFTTDASGLAQVTVRTTTPGAVTASVSGALNPARCGMGVAAQAGNSCVYTAALSKLKFDVPHHVGGVSQSVVVQALKSVEDGSRCAAAFASTEKTVSFTCSSLSHAGLTGVVALQGNGAGAAQGSCHAGGQNHQLRFDAAGNATITVRYDDAGQTNISASFAGTGAEAGLSMSGSDSFITVPKTLSMVANGPFVAGTAGVTSPATFQVRALNQNDQVMTAFGNEASNKASVTVSKSGQSPSDAAYAKVTGASITLSTLPAGNNVASGVASGALKWAEVGTLDLSAAISAGSVYSGAGIAVSGSLSGVGPFAPHHYDLEVTQGSASPCVSSFTYSGESFTTKISAKNADNAITENFDGRNNFAKASTLSAASSTGAAGSLTGAAITKEAFIKGVATVTPSYAFANKLTAPDRISLSASANDASINSSAGSGGLVSVRSGRLYLSNAFGAGQTALKVPAQLQYWSGKTWVLNTDDQCTVIPSNAVILARYLDSKGAVSAARWGGITASGFTSAAGQGNITLSKPVDASTGTIELAVNLGSSATDGSCLSAHPAGGFAQKLWLRGPHGACSGAGPFDPSARATIGVHSPEKLRVMHAQDVY